MSASTHNVWCINGAEKDSNRKVMVCKSSLKPQYNKSYYDLEKWDPFVSLPSPTMHKPLKTEDSPEKATKLSSTEYPGS